jgi:hypothetical protein
MDALIRFLEANPDILLFVVMGMAVLGYVAMVLS